MSHKARNKQRINHRRHLHSAYVWHRRVGLSLCIVVLWLAVTGLILNHNDGLKLGHHSIPASWAQTIYGVETPPPQAWLTAQQGFLADAQQLVLADNTHLLDGPLVGAAELDGLIIAASQSEVLILTADGELVERLQSGLPLPLTAAGSTSNSIVLNSVNGLISSSDLLTWQAYIGTTEVEWSAPRPVTSQQLKQWPQQSPISWERLLLDFHAGRILGPLRIVIADLAAIGMILLSLTGVYTWYTRRRRRNS